MTGKNAELLAPWRAFFEAHRNVVNVLGREMEETTGLPLSWYEVLLHLQEAPQRRLRMHELADLMLLSRSAVTRFVDRMEAGGLVERVACPSDKRGLEVVMTAEGEAMFRKAGRVHLRGIAEHFSAHLTPEEAAVVGEAMSRVKAAARAARSGWDAA
jgi:DNA-binding MarR family transcriptional regulator